MKSLLFFLLASRCFGAALLEWDFNFEPNVIDYRIYSGTNSRSYSSVTNFGNVNKVWLPRLKLQPGFTFIALTAFNDAGFESEFSEELTYEVPPRGVFVPVTNVCLRVPSGKYYVEGAQNLSTWTAIATVTGPTNMYFPIANQIGFFRWCPFFVAAKPAKAGKLSTSKAVIFKATPKPAPANEPITFVPAAPALPPFPTRQ